jgi:hypothetical protein
MKYYVYDTDKGYQEFETVEDATNMFKTIHFESRYTAIGMTEGVVAIDVIFKQELDGKVIFRASADFLSSGLYEKNPEQVKSELMKIHKSLNIPSEVLEDILESNVESNEQLDDDLEMM